MGRRLGRFAPFVCLVIPFVLLPARADELSDLAADFWAWRAATQPFSGDDIPRIERPAEFTPEWSWNAVEARKKKLAYFESRWAKIQTTGWPVTRQVDYRLIGSALARVQWELDVERAWLRNPRFYVDQTLGALFDTLTPPPPFDAGRSRRVMERIQAIPGILEDGKANLARGREMARPFGTLAIDTLTNVRARLEAAGRSLGPLLTGVSQTQLNDALAAAGKALESYRAWIETQLPQMTPGTAIGRDRYLFFLRKVALMPFTPEQLLETGRQEWERAVAFEAYEHNRNRGLPELPLFADQAAQMAREQEMETGIRGFLEEKNILSVPQWMQHYRNLPVPEYLTALGMGVTDDLTSATRLKENATSYIRPPSSKLGYFALATARDPRPILVHEGVPGHYFQLALGWAHADPIRRHFYDSGANEGIGFYAEEMMLQAGYFDDSPRTREIIYNFMRLRALRVEVDVKLALGEFTIEQGAEYLEKMVPMDRETALAEASDFASWPGQAISYQIGKVQILRMLARERREQGPQFDLRKFHDFVWRNGNVPLSLVQWELLGDASDVPAR